MAEAPVDSAPTPARVRRGLLVLASTLAALVVCLLTLWAGGAADVVSVPGIPAPPPVIAWLVPALRLIADAAAVLTVGCLFGAVVLVPGDTVLSTAGYRWVRLAGWGAVAWALASLASLPVLLADFLGTGFSAVSLRGVWSFVESVEQGRNLVIVAALAALVAAFARTVLHPAGARVLLLIALAATIPPAFTSHSADEADHNLAVTAVALHVLGVVLWAGGLLALMLAARLAGPGRVTAVERFSRLALPLAVVVAGSGAVTAYTRFSSPYQLVGTGYGVVLLAKVAAFVGLLGLAAWHRRRTLPALRAERPAAFLRLAGAEVILFAATIGLAVGLARTPTPPPVLDTDAAAAEQALLPAISTAAT
ncbi:copper resistance D family protein [Modestobacter marinus]|uniref:Putative copper resistance protein D n=1 Tax=Modestobacter marinus TaxID=477641 RepID=A0A846LUM9_9ACTN|nr:CopD family protein [Modestobacter marinus]NIH70062.1 putative copper resistance protein D [Modestobacter marinus]